jgi:hypothetical protein
MPIGNKGSMNHLSEDFNLWLGKKWENLCSLWNLQPSWGRSNVKAKSLRWY